MSNFKSTGMSGGGFTLGTQNPPGGGFSFGQPQTTTSTATIKGFLSTPSVTTQSAGIRFGNTLGAPTATAGSLPFGSAATTMPLTGQATIVPTVGGFSSATSTATVTTNASGLPFGSATTLTNPSTTVPAIGGFPLSTAVVATPLTTSGFSFASTPAVTGTVAGTGFSLGVTTLTPASSAATGFPLGAMAMAPPPTSGFSGGGLGMPTPPLASTGFSFGNAPQAALAKPANFGFGMSATTPQAITAPICISGGLGGAGMGLGGVQPPSANAGANSIGAKSDGKSAKKQQMPHDLFGTIAVFESWRNHENSASEENIRQTADPFHKVGKKAEEIQQLLAELTSEYLQLHSSAVNLKAEVMKEAEHVEMARRTKETPMALQGENKAPEVYFINLVRSFEAEMIYCRNKIDEVSLCMQAASNPCETPADIAEVLQREHEALKEMASKVYAKHNQLVELSKHLSTKTVPNEQAFFRQQSKQAAKTPASAVTRPALGGSSTGSGLQAFQEQQQRAKAVTLGAAPPTMPLVQTSTPSLFGSNTGSSIFSGGPSFGSNAFGLGNTAGNTLFATKSVFGNTPTGLGSNLGFGMNQTNIQQTSSPFSMNSSFNTKPFGS